MDGVSLKGRLVEGGGANGLVWQPALGRSPSPSPLPLGFSGRIVYRDPPTPAAPPVPQPAPLPGAAVIARDVVIVGRVQNNRPPMPAPQSPPATGRRAR